MQGATPEHASLQGLPFDLKIAVLQFLPGILALKSLVIASKEYFAVYRDERQLILSSILRSELPPAILFEAISVQDARGLPPGKDKEAITSFLNQYKIKRSTRPDINTVTLESLISISRTHYLIEAVANDYATSIVVTNPRTGKTEGSPLPISHNEERRLHRALYRVELFCSLFENFNRYGEQVQALPSSFFFDSEMARIFLALFSPWQVEEITCIRNWVVHYYARVLIRRKREVYELHYKHYGCNLRPWGKLPFSQHDESAERLLSLGLQFFHKATQEIFIDPREEVDLPPDIGANQEFLTDSLYEYREQRRPSRTLETKFTSDVCGPNAAWDWCRPIREKRSHNHWHVEELRDIGYVMWDRERLEDWAVLNMDPDDVASDLEERRASESQ